MVKFFCSLLSVIWLTNRNKQGNKIDRICASLIWNQQYYPLVYSMYTLLVTLLILQLLVLSHLQQLILSLFTWICCISIQQNCCHLQTTIKIRPDSLEQCLFLINVTVCFWLSEYLYQRQDVKMMLTSFHFCFVISDKLYFWLQNIFVKNVKLWVHITSYFMFPMYLSCSLDIL